MIRKLAVKLTVFLLQQVDLSIEDRSLLITLLLKNLGALPIRDIITSGPDGSLVISGQPVDLELAKKLRESARAALENSAYKLVHDQARYEAITTGFLEADSEKRSLFGKAAIWYAQCEQSHLTKLAQVGGEEE